MKKRKERNNIIYTPESDIRSPGKLLRSMVRDLNASRELSWRLFIRDISAQYRQSLLGLFWAFVPPVITGLVFIILQSKKIINFGETSVPYPVFALVGTTLWQLFTESLNAPLKTVVNAKPMLAKINFPREALILSAFYQILFNLLIKSLILAVIILYFGVTLTKGVIFAPVAILMLILLGLTIGVFLTPLGTLYTDIASGLMVFTQFWFFVTPVVYPPPNSFPFSLIATVNPVAPILVATRDLITTGVISNKGPFIIISILTLIGFFIAWLLYRLALPIIIERMSA